MMTPLLSILAGVIIMIGFISYSVSKLFKSSQAKTLKILKGEISRARRAHRGIGILFLQLSDQVPRGVHDFLPGRTIMVKVFEGAVRDSDFVSHQGHRVYSVILPETKDLEGPQIVKERIEKLAASKEWGQIKIGVASYPQNGAKAKELMDYALKDGDIQY